MLKRPNYLSSLEILLLLFIKSGLETSYDLMAKIGLGPGATSPSLKRLEASQLLTSTGDTRRRMRYAITEEGEQQLKGILDEGPRGYWIHGRRDTFDSLRRAIFLAWVSSGPEDAMRCIRHARVSIEEMARSNDLDAKHLRNAALHLRERMLKVEEPGDDNDLITTVYRWIDAEVDAAQYIRQVEALDVVEALVSDLPPAPCIWPEISDPKET